MTAKAIAYPDISVVSYEHDDDIEVTELKVRVTALTQCLGEVIKGASKLHVAIVNVSTEETKMGQFITLFTQIQLPAGNPAQDIGAVISVAEAVNGVLAKAKQEVVEITLLLEELAKEQYCIALSEDPKLAPKLEDMDVRDTSSPFTSCKCAYMTQS